jgi:radical SAM superfamily enzyme YgiQ (UPF0313 family)
MDNKTLWLVCPSSDRTYDGLELKMFKSVPIGLELIAKGTELAVPDCSIKVVDGNVTNLCRILKGISEERPHWIGISDLYSNHHNALKIAEHAHLTGATTIIGGPNATHLADRILKNRDFVDFVVRGDGERATSLLVAGEKPINIPNLTYRVDEQVVSNPRHALSLDIIFDLEHLDDLSLYDKNNAIPLSSIRGCVKAEQDKRCSFCSIDHKLKLMNPELVWQQIDLLNSRYGFDYFFEAGDNFLVGDYPQRLLDARPNHLTNIRFRLYVSPDQINEVSIEVLRQFNPFIFIGVDSADDLILKRSGKGLAARRVITSGSLQYTLYSLVFVLLSNSPQVCFLRNFANFANLCSSGSSFMLIWVLN